MLYNLSFVASGPGLAMKLRWRILLGGVEKGAFQLCSPTLAKTTKPDGDDEPGDDVAAAQLR